MQKTKNSVMRPPLILVGRGAEDARPADLFGKIEYFRIKDSYDVRCSIQDVRIDFDPAYIKIAYKGEKISFGFEYGGPRNELVGKVSADPWHNTIYCNTNEYNGIDVENALKKTAHLTHYVGIAGGPDGTLARLGALSSVSDLKDIRLIDRNGQQIFCNVIRFIEYDSNPMGLIRASNYFNAFDDFGSRPEGLTASLNLSDMKEAVDGIKDPGRYFIYLSNAYSIEFFEKGSEYVSTISGYVGENVTHDLLRGILRNNNIQGGSCVMFAEPFMLNNDRTMIIQKNGKTFSVFDFVPGHHSRDLRIDTDLQERFFGYMCSDDYSPKALKDKFRELMESRRG